MLRFAVSILNQGHPLVPYHVLPLSTMVIIWTWSVMVNRHGQQLWPTIVIQPLWTMASHGMKYLVNHGHTIAYYAVAETMVNDWCYLTKISTLVNHGKPWLYSHGWPSLTMVEIDLFHRGSLSLVSLVLALNISYLNLFITQFIITLFWI